MDTAYWDQFQNIAVFRITLFFLLRVIAASQHWVNPPCRI